MITSVSITMFAVCYIHILFMMLEMSLIKSCMYHNSIQHKQNRMIIKVMDVPNHSEKSRRRKPGKQGFCWERPLYIVYRQVTIRTLLDGYVSCILTKESIVSQKITVEEKGRKKQKKCRHWRIS